MNREIHVRFCEGLRVRFPWATHLDRFIRATVTEFSRYTLVVPSTDDARYKHDGKADGDPEVL